MSKQQREYYRINYPMAERPSLISREEEFEVIDVSEYGVKFKIQEISPFILGEEVTADIRFSDDEVYPCSGHINRYTNKEVVILLETPIPLNKIRSEHIHLINRRSPLYV
ncbi:MAG: PilZ domain-containing protein [Gammaproteobacteria bacterium]|nr:PilZ domain-containing protein [Gammaproteobacteria bacterium]